jgi:putative transposase
MAESLLEYAQGKACIADAGYDSNQFVQAIKLKGKVPEVANNPRRKERRPIDSAIYGLRYRVECFFHTIKRCRRVATRYEKTAANYMAFLSIACSLIWIG